jgi:hypothetical protein
LIPATASPASLTIFAGRFGSGKTEASIAYAISLSDKQGTGVVLIDLDVVTPYFRSREAQDMLARRGVEVIAPLAIGRHLDTPAITPQILGAIEQLSRPTVLDVGGDRQGARVLGQFSHAITQRGYSMHFVVNPYRPFSDSLPALAASIAEIEESSRLKVTSIASNPNLMEETTAEQIFAGHARIERFAQELGLPVAVVCLTRRWEKTLGGNHFSQPVLLLDRFLTHPWETPMPTLSVGEGTRGAKERQ